MVDDPPAVFSLEAFGGQKPDCPVCTRHADSPGHVCYGRRSFWTRKHLCPTQPHFHPRCIYCKHVWLMAGKRSTP